LEFRLFYGENEAQGNANQRKDGRDAAADRMTV
jgi:hypothetical protein